MTGINQVAILATSIHSKDKKLVLNGPGLEKNVPVGDT
jgi:hypothetical protein